MEQDLEYIDEYFEGRMSALEKARFEQKILDDKSFAGDVAFYLVSRVTAKDEARKSSKERFRELYRQENAKAGEPDAGAIQGKRLWPYVAVAASVLAVLVGWYLFTRPVSEQQLAGRYIQQHFQTLSVSMGTKTDSIETGLRLYNEGKRAEALFVFEYIAKSDESVFEAVKYAGIVSLELKDYDKALGYFGKLAGYNLYTNPGLFYEAITLMARNRGTDQEQGKKLLEQVVRQKLEGYEIAQKWLSQL